MIKEKCMEALFEKLNSFHILTNLIPGTVFCFVFNKLLFEIFPSGEKVSDYFVFYFIGIIIGRIGSLFVEPLCRKTKNFKHVSYQRFLLAEKEDSKIENLSETNSLYRSLLTAFVLLTFFVLINEICYNFIFLCKWRNVIICICLSILFFFSFKKQTQYIFERAEHIDKITTTEQ